MHCKYGFYDKSHGNASIDCFIIIISSICMFEEKCAYNLFMMAKMRSLNGKRQSNHLFSLHLKVIQSVQFSMFILPMHTLYDQASRFLPYIFTQNIFIALSSIVHLATKHGSVRIGNKHQTIMSSTLGVETNNSLLFQMVVC